MTVFKLFDHNNHPYHPCVSDNSGTLIYHIFCVVQSYLPKSDLKENWSQKISFFFLQFRPRAIMFPTSFSKFCLHVAVGGVI